MHKRLGLKKVCFSDKSDLYPHAGYW